VMTQESEREKGPRCALGCEACWVLTAKGDEHRKEEVLMVRTG